MTSRRYVVVPVTAVWATPSAPRDIDGWAVARVPDVVAWLADLDAAGARQGLHGRMVTQLECGEPVLIIGHRDGSTASATGPITDNRAGVTDDPAGQRLQQIVAPIQPSSLDARGYPGWVPAEHVGAKPPDCPPAIAATLRVSGSADGVGGSAGSDAGEADGRGGDADAAAFVTMARRYLGVPYLWGGTCDVGLDCSGLVHLSLRRLGLLVPRDAGDQYDACEHIPAVGACPGDLFFFARDGGRPHHVGIVTSPGRMIHAPETGSVVIEEALTRARESTLIGAGRLPWQPRPTVTPRAS